MQLSQPLHPYDAYDVPKPIITDASPTKKEPIELTISVKSDEKRYLYPRASTEDLVSPPQSAASSTLV